MTDTSAEVHLNVVHAVPGFTALPTPTVPLLSERNASVSLTVEPDKLCIHVDRRNALAALLFTGGLGDKFEERFADAFVKARSDREKKRRSNAWLVTDVHMPAILKPEHTRQLPDFALSIDSISHDTSEDLRRLADSALGRVIASLSMTLGESRFPNTKRAGAANYSMRPRGPLTYEFQIKVGSPSLSISSPADTDLIDSVVQCIGQLPTLGLETGVRLYKVALEESDNQLQTFIAAWAALEILVNKAFSANFNSASLSKLDLRGSDWERGLNARLSQTKEHEVGIEDRFAFLAVSCSKGSASDDTKLFAKLNGVRNDLYHRGIVPTSLPSRDTIRFFQRYISLLIQGSVRSV